MMVALYNELSSTPENQVHRSVSHARNTLGHQESQSCGTPGLVIIIIAEECYRLFVVSRVDLTGRAVD
jgi:hypothetical protein